MMEQGNASPVTGESRSPIIDCDVHQTFREPSEVTQYLDPYFRPRGIQLVSTGFHSPVGLFRGDASPERGGPPGSCPETICRQHLDAYGIDYAVLTGSGILAVGIAPEIDYGTALARAYNEWLISYWLDRDPRFLGALLINPQDPPRAADEIRRVGRHPKMVQVLMTSATRIPYGQRFYHPIYRAAEEMGLPVAIHPGNEGRALANPPSAAGWPTSYLEWHTNLSQNSMAQVASIVLEGVFELFPKLKFVCIEGGFGWMPHLMWRMDKNWKALRSLSPWLKRAPSEYIIEHVRLTTQPIEEPERPEHLLQIFEMMHAERTVLFSSDYPHWDNDSPFRILENFSADLRERIFYRSAQELYRLPDPEPAGTKGAGNK